MARPKGIPSHCRGKTYEELYGRERAERKKLKQKQAVKAGIINCRCCNLKVDRQAPGQKYCTECAKKIRAEQFRKGNLKYSKRSEIIEKRKVYIKDYYNKNKERIILNTLKWQKKPEVKKRRLEREKSPERRIKRKEYKENNSEKIHNWQRIYCRKPESKKRKSERNRSYRRNPELAVVIRLRDLLKYSLRRRYNRKVSSKSLRMYGIDFNKIREQLRPYPEDISKYHIDHIRPLCSFRFLKEDGSEDLDVIKEAFAPENHRWLLKEENLAKVREDMKMSVRRNKNG